MAGGRSRRLSYDKLVAEIMGIPSLMYTYSALLYSHARPIYAAVSNNSAAAKNLLESIGVRTILTPGRSYVDDIVFLSNLFKKPFLTLAADAIFVRAHHINRLIDVFEGKSMAAAVRGNGRTSYVGLNIVVPGHNDDQIYYFDAGLLEVSLNTTTDIDEIRRILWSGGFTLLLQ